MSIDHFIIIEKAQSLLSNKKLCKHISDCLLIFCQSHYNSMSYLQFLISRSWDSQVICHNTEVYDHGKFQMGSLDE